MVKIKTNEEIENKSCSLYDNNDKYIGEISSGLILTDVCVQIKELCINSYYSGYYIMFEGVKTEIQSDGRIYFDIHPFNAMGDMLMELF